MHAKDAKQSKGDNGLKTVDHATSRQLSPPMNGRDMVQLGNTCQSANQLLLDPCLYKS